MVQILRRELLDQLTSFKFAAELVIVLVLFAVNGLVFALRYKAETIEYRQVQQRWDEELARRQNLDNLPNQDFMVLKIPLKTAFVASGGQTRLPNAYRFSIRIWGDQPGTFRAFSQNALIESYKALDWSFLVGTAFSLLALVFAYDSISGEKASGTLKLLQTYNLSRSSILFGKFLANLLALMLTLVAGMLLSLLLLLLVGQIELSGAEWTRVGLFLLLAAFYIALFLGLGLLLSTLTHRPTATMVLGVMLWVISIVVIPGVGTLLVQKIQKLPTANEVGERAGRVWDQVNHEYDNKSSVWRGRDMGKADNYQFEKVSTEAQNKRRRLQAEIWDDYLRQKFQQARLVRRISSVSPTGLFETGAESLNGAGVLREEKLVTQSRQYRSLLEEWVRQRDLGDPASPHLFFQPGYLSQQPFEASSVPRYEFREATAAEGLRDSLWRVVLLAGEAFVILFAGIVAFQRYDVR
jgi:ABC-type transport system involved in multi-copper enzyme maturation permease subunit